MSGRLESLRWCHLLALEDKLGEFETNSRIVDYWRNLLCSPNISHWPSTLLSHILRCAQLPVQTRLLTLNRRDNLADRSTNLAQSSGNALSSICDSWASRAGDLRETLWSPRPSLRDLGGGLSSSILCSVGSLGGCALVSDGDTARELLWLPQRGTRCRHRHGVQERPIDRRGNCSSRLNWRRRVEGGDVVV